ncbi:MAG: cobalt ECF transporter T component CbiQ [Candidatus Altiarchaeales archaeon IMC4]|nr:MAG: cobalt ECF transporter T component CbiQ [Candidatus Altiarchaeales archaeon IMC4]
MHHSFIDKYSNLNSIVHRIDSRAKILSFFSLLLIVVLTPPSSLFKFYLYFLLIFAVIIISRVPPGFVFRRSLIVLPFAFAITFFNLVTGSMDMVMFIAISAKAWLSALSMIVLVSTTPFAHLMKGLERLGVPRVIVMVMSFMYRYLFILADEAMRIGQARDCRSSGGNLRLRLRTVGSIIGVLFIRSYERGERVYAAMASRAFDGSVRTLDKFTMGKKDAAFFSLILIPSIIIFIT